jgi:hypothetical protein
MTLSECTHRGGPTGLQVASNGKRSCDLNVVEEVADQLSDVIYDLVSHRPDSSDGVAWLYFDAALCALHSALVALEELGGVRKLDHLPSVVNSGPSAVDRMADAIPGDQSLQRTAPRRGSWVNRQPLTRHTGGFRRLVPTDSLPMSERDKLGTSTTQNAKPDA